MLQGYFRYRAIVLPNVHIVHCNDDDDGDDKPQPQHGNGDDDFLYGEYASFHCCHIKVFFE